MITLSEAALDVLTTPAPKEKARKTRDYALAWREGGISEIGAVKLPNRPARPEKPELRDAREMPKRAKAGSTKSKIALLHAIAHIELNAIDLAWDVMSRTFDLSGFYLPKEFYDDWIKVADDEARHFTLIYDYLQTNDCHYGDYPAHNGLWEMTEKTDHNILHRMALIPRVLEARGLDVTPGMIDKLEKAGDVEAAKILNVIYEDEISHVETGSRWFHYHCQLANLDAEKTFIDIVNQYMEGKVRGPFNEAARLIAGFKQEELDRLNILAH